jgi:hypothetical protein
MLPLQGHGDHPSISHRPHGREPMREPNRIQVRGPRPHLNRPRRRLDRNLQHHTHRHPPITPSNNLRNTLPRPARHAAQPHGVRASPSLCPCPGTPPQVVKLSACRVTGPEAGVTW